MMPPNAGAGARAGARAPIEEAYDDAYRTQVAALGNFERVNRIRRNLKRRRQQDEPAPEQEASQAPLSATQMMPQVDGDFPGLSAALRASMQTLSRDELEVERGKKQSLREYERDVERGSGATSSSVSAAASSSSSSTSSGSSSSSAAAPGMEKALSQLATFHYSNAARI